MPLYRWRALDRAGHIAEGEMDASSHSQVADRLRWAGCLILTAEPVGTHLLPPGLAGLFQRRTLLPPRDLARLFRQLSQLLGAGLPLDRALDALAALGAATPLGTVVAGLAMRVAAGASLADSMDAAGGLFPPIATGMIRTGEAMGAVATLSSRVAEMNRRAADLRQSAAAGLQRAGAALLALLCVGAVSRGLGIAVAAPMGSVALLLLFADPAWRPAIARFLLVLPGLGPLLTAFEIARLLRGASILLACGAPLPVALAVLKLQSGNGVVATQLAAAGKVFPLSQAMTAVPNFPRRAVRLMAAGEYGGRRAEAAARAALMVEARARRTLTRVLMSAAVAVTLAIAGGLMWALP